MFVTYYMTNCFALRIAFTEQATCFAQTVVDVLEDQVSATHCQMMYFDGLNCVVGVTTSLDLVVAVHCASSDDWSMERQDL